ncbi:MAG TPA: hypothetical protein VF134_09535 [Candidatus Dormibacteraeota bacterium]
MINTRSLEHRRHRAALHTALPAGAHRRRRRAHRELVDRAALAAGARVQAPSHLRLYVGVGVAVLVLIGYLLLAAQVTQTSYELARLQNRQAELISEQAQLRLAAADAHTPAQVEHDAAAAGMVRQPAAGYPVYQPVAINLDAPTGEGPTDSQPRWEQAVASLLGTVTGTREVLASDR